MEEYLKSTYYIDYDHPAVVEFAQKNCSTSENNTQKAVQLYYAVRDSIRYDPYSIEPKKESMKASAVLLKGHGYCVAKAVLLAACTRSQKIPSRLGFADVKNHLNTKRLAQLMGTDIFVYHGYTELFLNNTWVKATPAFNLTLCQNFNVKPLEFDGTKDSIFHPFDTSGNKHMEYVKDHGTFSDLPWDMILAGMIKSYPVYFKNLDKRSKDFCEEALKENQ
ncbi:MAG: transglutaminase family protein [Proteobacteria bacterium]|nr:transglutaminase family protein [Pseudomonadota bacterium]MBU1582211.1 transglutaminase family protein [Pseudomonadota bacterium]MBU2455595.1 transglutaminase family protein [Pseudomonadota bacterium]MBU2627069.1 transglutaminase family protein [Pseudomonadota bacterium]